MKIEKDNIWAFFVLMGMGQQVMGQTGTLPGTDNDNTSQAAKEFAIKICASTCLFGAWGII